jgi:hypothetical protein
MPKPTVPYIFMIGLSIILIFALIYVVAITKSREIEIPVIVGNVNPLSFESLVSNLDTDIIGIRIRVERAYKYHEAAYSYFTEKSSDGYLNISRSGNNTHIGSEILFHDGYYDFRDGWIVDGFYKLSTTGPHQGVMSYSLQMIESEKVLLNSDIKLHEVNIDTQK